MSDDEWRRQMREPRSALPAERSADDPKPSETWRHADGGVRVDHMDSRPGDYYGGAEQSEAPEPPPVPHDEHMAAVRAFEQAGYRRGLAESKPQSDLSFAESEYERGVRTEARAHAHLIEKAADEAYERGVREERERIVAVLDRLVFEDTSAKGSAILIKLCDVLEATDG